ncbi:MAG: hypothetical protein OEW08_01185 [Gammaproteobacteria bacterium]|nr:hypothetical protein [Gammaproteobacteria bacterium]
MSITVWRQWLVLGLFALAPVHNSGAAGIPDIIGTWKANVSIQTPPGFGDFLDLFSFSGGGVLAESHPLYSPYHPLGTILYAPGLGSWRSEPNGGYVARFILPMQGAPDNQNYAGQFIGTNTIDYTLTLDSTGTLLSGAWTATGRDVNGNITLSANGTMSATRVEVR